LLSFKQVAIVRAGVLSRVEPWPAEVVPWGVGGKDLAAVALTAGTQGSRKRGGAAGLTMEGNAMACAPTNSHLKLQRPYRPLLQGHNRMKAVYSLRGEHIVCRHRKLWSAAGHCGHGRLRGDEPDSSPTSFLRRPDFQRFRDVVADLRRLCPPAFPVVVRTSELPPDLDGLAKRRWNRFVIHLDKNLGQDAALSVLLHEWAHCRSWSLMLDKAADDTAAGRMSPEEFELVSHNGSFGVAYSELWGTFTTRILPGLND